jgi:cytochrome c oxidase cbb3-type subunit III
MHPKRKADGLGTVAMLAIALLSASGCEREARPFPERTATATGTPRPGQSQLYPGGVRPAESATASPFQENAYGMAEGKRLFEAFNCSGCHAHGGGGMGPPLMDDRWIYGARPGNIFASIVEGRPNGMPTWRNKIPDQQVWQIVAYIQSMNGQAPIDVLPGRSDHLSAGTPENLRPAQRPVETGTP